MEEVADKDVTDAGHVITTASFYFNNLLVLPSFPISVIRLLSVKIFLRRSSIQGC